jgi:hypothetical protein
MRVFVSHPYKADPEGNKKKVDLICKDLVNQGHIPISPLHLFSFCENDNEREEILDICRCLIDICDIIYIYGDSEGCNIEKEYAEIVGIPIKVIYE